MLNRGKLAVVTMFAVALAAAGTAWWFNFNRGQRTLDFYGRDAALMIRTAPRVELLVLMPAADSTSGPSEEMLILNNQRLQVAHRHDMSHAKGLINARTSLLADSSYRWDADPGDCQPRIEYAVRYRGQTTATLAFDFGCRQVWHVEQKRSMTLIPKVVEGWQSFLSRQAAEATTTKQTNPTNQAVRDE
jgi:hypothetical protein